MCAYMTSCVIIAEIMIGIKFCHKRIVSFYQTEQYKYKFAEFALICVYIACCSRWRYSSVQVGRKLTK